MRVCNLCLFSAGDSEGLGLGAAGEKQGLPGFCSSAKWRSLALRKATELGVLQLPCLCRAQRLLGNF